LILGSTSKSEAITLFDEPYTTKTMRSANENVEIFEYKYAITTPNFIKARFLSLEFRDSKLSGYSFISSFPLDRKESGFQQYGNIKVNFHKKTDVIKIMGEPSSKALCPSKLHPTEACDYNEAWYWLIPKGMEIDSISVTFKDDDVVKAVKTNIKSKK
jgi:hypothetical protein